MESKICQPHLQIKCNFFLSISTSGTSQCLYVKFLLPPLDHPPGADHALERFTAFPGRIEHGAILKSAGVLGGDQRALDHGFAGALAGVGDLQFVVAHGALVG